ncbi:MAG: hypothetical protein EBX37_17300, partial [Alphaproteobacteria bacterium]|nr:hypothetical protein [Alphaproteobacteria bacterium]
RGGSCAVVEDREFIGLYLNLFGAEIDQDRIVPWMIRLTFDRVKKENKLITNQMICDIIQKHFGSSEVHCIPGPDNVVEPVVHIRFYNSERSDRSGAERSGEGNESSEGDELDEGDSTFYTRVMQMMLESIAVSGVKGINKVFMRQQNNNEWLLDTEGINLNKVLTCEGVDATKTSSNVISEVFSVLGIEAARSVLLKELRGVIERVFDAYYKTWYKQDNKWSFDALFL